MSEIEITLPTVAYGNVKIKATPEEWGLDDIADAPNVGVWAAIYLNLFVQGFKHGAKMDVDAHLGASPEALEEKAQVMLDEGLGGVTEVADELTRESQGLPDDAPWSQKVDAKPKPWETGTNTPDKAVAALGSGW